MTIDLLACVPAELAESADLDELLNAVCAIEHWQERQAQVLDHIYRFRLTRCIATRAPVEELRALDEHLSRVAHPRRQAALDALAVPYYARWCAYRQILDDRLAVLTGDAPQLLLSRSRVADILALVVERGELTQQAIGNHFNLAPANLTRILGMMEANELIERRKIGREKRIVPGINAARFHQSKDSEPLGVIPHRGSWYLQRAA